jgi:hypothetical protein
MDNLIAFGGREFFSFGSRDYWLMFLLLLFGRGMDILSTRVATPNLVLEGNPIAKKMGWTGGIITAFAIAFGMAFWLSAAVAISTMSVLVAARNFQYAWLMRTMGEEHYRDWHVARIQETRVTLYLFCLAGNTLLTAAVGAAVFFFGRTVISISIGMGMIGYAIAVAFYTLLAVWRLRRAAVRKEKRQQNAPVLLVTGPTLKSTLADSCACETGDYPGK